MSTSRIFSVGLAVTLICLGLSSGVVRAEEGLWTSDFAAAKAKAKADKKYLLVDFTGSDWCSWCIKLRNEVFNKDTFKTEAPKRYVLVELDFPRSKKLPAKVKAQNDKLARQYEIRGYPTIIMMDADGKVIARTGYRQNGPEEYMEHLEVFSKTYDGILKMKEELAKTQGTDRAKLLDRLIASYDKLGNQAEELVSWGKEIVAIDADNKAGLRKKYEYRVALVEAEQLAKETKYVDAIAVLEKALDISDLSDEQKQDIYFLAGQYHIKHKQPAAAAASFTAALNADPESRKAAQIKVLLKLLPAAVKAQEFITKNLDGVEKAEGVEKAKLLDQLTTANSKLAPIGGSNFPPAKLEAWRKQIIKLDADGKAGLKTKYQFPDVIRQVAALGQRGKFAEAQSAVDKGLAASGLSGEQKQQGYYLKGFLYQQDGDPQKAVENFKKAVESEPGSNMAPYLKAMMKRAEQAAEEKAAEKKPAEKKADSEDKE